MDKYKLRCIYYNSEQWLQIEKNEVTIKMNHMPTRSVTYEIGFDGYFYTKFVGYLQLTYNILHLDYNLFVIKFSNTNIEQHFKR